MTGVQHRWVTALLVIPTSYAVFKWTDSTVLATCAGIGTAIGLVIAPDLDLAENSNNILHWPFYIYGKLIAHRSFFSHFFLVGTIGRVLYITFMLWPIWLLLGQPPINMNVDFLKWAFVGLATSDGAHFICDGFGIEHRRMNGNHKAPKVSRRSHRNKK